MWKEYHYPLASRTCVCQPAHRMALFSLQQGQVLQLPHPCIITHHPSLLDLPWSILDCLSNMDCRNLFDTG
jgi:hypothetical protein